MHMNLIDEGRLETITDWANRLAGHPLAELRRRQMIVENQMADAYQRNEQGNPISDTRDAKDAQLPRGTQAGSRPKSLRQLTTKELEL